LESYYYFCELGAYAKHYNDHFWEKSRKPIEKEVRKLRISDRKFPLILQNIELLKWDHKSDINMDHFQVGPGRDVCGVNLKLLFQKGGWLTCYGLKNKTLYFYFKSGTGLSLADAPFLLFSSSY
jgi:hypothetical protein